MNMVAVHPLYPPPSCCSVLSLSKGAESKQGGFSVRLSEAQPLSNVPLPVLRVPEVRGLQGRTMS